MKKKICNYILLSLSFLLLSACIAAEKNTSPIMYDFLEPTSFPFDVSETSTKIDIPKPDNAHQFIFQYYNKETTQQINYIMSKVLADETKDNVVSKNDKTEYKLANGLSAFYSESLTSQSLWWETNNGFLARFIYFTHGNTKELGEYKLEVEDLLNLANQVQ